MKKQISVLCVLALSAGLFAADENALQIFSEGNDEGASVAFSGLTDVVLPPLEGKYSEDYHLLRMPQDDLNKVIEANVDNNIDEASGLFIALYRANPKAAFCLMDQELSPERRFKLLMALPESFIGEFLHRMMVDGKNIFDAGANTWGMTTWDVATWGDVWNDVVMLKYYELYATGVTAVSVLSYWALNYYVFTLQEAIAAAKVTPAQATPAQATPATAVGPKSTAAAKAAAAAAKAATTKAAEATAAAVSLARVQGLARNSHLIIPACAVLGVIMGGVIWSAELTELYNELFNDRVPYSGFTSVEMAQRYIWFMLAYADCKVKYAGHCYELVLIDAEDYSRRVGKVTKILDQLISSLGAKRYLASVMQLGSGSKDKVKLALKAEIEGTPWMKALVEEFLATGDDKYVAFPQELLRSKALKKALVEFKRGHAVQLMTDSQRQGYRLSKENVADILRELGSGTKNNKFNLMVLEGIQEHDPVYFDGLFELLSCGLLEELAPYVEDELLGRISTRCQGESSEDTAHAAGEERVSSSGHVHVEL